MRYLFLASILLSAGCSEADAEKVRLVGEKTYERASHLVLAIWDELGKTLLEQKPAPVAEPDVQTRVAQRLRWDRELAELTIVILGTPEQVILSGQVKTETQKLRALRLATDTLGVSSVKDELEIAPPQETTVVLPEE